MAIKNNFQRYQGFTLIELLITIIIISILATIGLPNYMDYMQKGRRPDATSILLKMANDQEIFYSAQMPNSYAESLATLGYASDPQPSEQGYYSISIVATPTAPLACDADPTTANPPCSAYTLFAAPVGGQASDPCGTFTLNSFGIKGKTGGDAAYTAAQCW